MIRFRRIFLYSFLVLYSHAICAVSTSPSEVLYDLSPFIRAYKTGKIERLLGTDTVPASIDPTTQVQSKDVTVSKSGSITARLFLPKNPNQGQKIPLLVYYHGGAFFTESASSPSYHNHMNSLVAKANVVVVSLNFRLAPEHPLPKGYEDSWIGLKWVFSHSKGSGSETWLNSYADFNRVSLGGDSSGANIAHNMAVRAGLEMGSVLDGMFLNCPHFWGKNAIGNESNASNSQVKSLMEGIWYHAHPSSQGLDNPLLNPASDPNISKLGCKRVLIIVAEIDILRDRGFYYNYILSNSGWKGTVKAVEYKGEQHDFGVRFPNSPNAIAMLSQFADFLNQK